MAPSCRITAERCDIGIGYRERVVARSALRELLDFDGVVDGQVYTGVAMQRRSGGDLRPGFRYIKHRHHDHDCCS